MGFSLFKKNTEFRTCTSCRRRGSSNDPKRRIVEIDKDYYCQECYDILEDNKKIINEDKRETKARENFSKIIDNFKSEFEVLLEFEYSKLNKTKVRYFFSRDGSEKIYSKDFTVNSDKNYAHLIISPSGKQHSTNWNTNGNYEIGDNFEAGYTLQVTLNKNDEKLRKNIINILQKYRFGCLPSSYSIHCHLDSNSPNEHEARELLQKIIKDISESS